MSSNQLHIAFDESHKPRGRIDSNYTTLRAMLEGAGFGCWQFSSFPITRESLQNYDVLVFPCTDSSKFSTQEMESISEWVREDGGGLLMLSHAGGDKGRRTNLSELAAQFGMVFENDQVLDETNNFGIDSMPVVRTFPTPHPVNDGIDSLCYRAGSSVTIVGIAEAIALSDFGANPGGATVIAAADCGEGRVLGIGSYEIFRDEIPGGINHQEHPKLIANVFNWLSTPTRRRLREGGAAALPGVASTQPSTTGALSPGSNPGHTSKLVKIESVKDLFTEIKNILHDVDLIKARVENVYRVVEMLTAAETSKESAGATAGVGGATAAPVESRTETASHEDDDPSPKVSAAPAATSQEDLMSLIAATKKGREAPAKEKAEESGSLSSPPPPPPASMGNLLSELRSEQQGMAKDRSAMVDDLRINQPGLGSVAPDEPDVVPDEKKKIDYTYEVTAADRRKKTGDLEDEIEKLEAKIKSVESLKGLIERKHDDGRIDDEEYEKEKGKFEADIGKTKAKIDAYKKLIAA